MSTPLATPRTSARVRRAIAFLDRPAVDRATAREHIEVSMQLLVNLLDLGSLDHDDRKDVRAALGRLWPALREIDRGNP